MTRTARAISSSAQLAMSTGLRSVPCSYTCAFARFPIVMPVDAAVGSDHTSHPQLLLYQPGRSVGNLARLPALILGFDLLNPPLHLPHRVEVFVHLRLIRRAEFPLQAGDVLRDPVRGGRQTPDGLEPAHLANLARRAVHVEEHRAISFAEDGDLLVGGIASFDSDVLPSKENAPAAYDPGLESHALGDLRCLREVQIQLPVRGPPELIDHVVRPARLVVRETTAPPRALRSTASTSDSPHSAGHSGTP